jgi:hypothetical protein
MRRADPLSWVAILALLLLAILGNWALYSCTDDSCKARGGHTEVIYGRHTGWTCVGADR